MQPEFLPPSSALTEPRLKPRSSIVAVLLGAVVVDSLGGGLTTILLTGTLITMSGGRQEEILSVLRSLGFRVAGVAIGAIFAVAGGYAAARWARRRPVAHAVATGIVSLLIGLPFAFRASVLEWWLLNVIVQVPLAALGGYFAGRRMT